MGRLSSQIRFDQVLAEYREALAFCRQLGLGRTIDLGRFGAYERRLDRLVSLLMTHGSQNLPDQARQELLENLEHFRVSLIEGQELANLLPYLRSCDPEAVYPKLNTALAGPSLPSEEASSTRARNFQFELLFASVLWKAGFAPVLGEHPDVSCRVGKQSFYFECKRLSSPARVRDRIREAGEQLRRDAKHGPSPLARGVIVISLTQVLNPKDLVVQVADRPTARRRLRDALFAVLESANAEYQRWADSGVAVGILMHGASTFENIENGLFERGQDWIGRTDTPRFASYTAELRTLIEKTEALADQDDLRE